MSRELHIRREAARRFWGVIDPELGVNIVDLGLIYRMFMRDDDTFVVEYTTTTAGCPMRRYLQRKIEEALQSIEEIEKFETKLVFEPEWSVEMIVEGVEFFSVPPPMMSG
ncbi:metal-sulfur cluster assembly factor [Rhodohalobacter sp. SW132]|uniref:metal-sulfur cluster assembly factor n=1 Tax=Rhodohalobacter sp. SW132 TaxID=2293433 RepID=UPI000E23A615|nr:metal-sulfur cluster assembly factor [Rhodohalobacter sp. SW132]REL38606.1 metal-sulfur cluster assembly factor [Rhodohalobacter sp. SW132]